MKEKKEKKIKKPSCKGRKALVVFGLLFILTGVFIASFTCSFQVMIQAENGVSDDENSIEAENKKLKEDIQLMQDQMMILESKLEPTASAKKSGSTSSGSTSSGSAGRSTSTSGNSN